MTPKTGLLKSSLGSGTLGLFRLTRSEFGRSLEAVLPQKLEKSESYIVRLDNVRCYCNIDDEILKTDH
jgi:hypothetical protein